MPLATWPETAYATKILSFAQSWNLVWVWTVLQAQVGETKASTLLTSFRLHSNKKQGTA